MLVFTVNKEENGLSLGKCVQRHLPFDLSLKGIKREIDGSCALRNGRVETFASKRLCVGDRIEVDIKRFNDKVAPKIYFEDQHLMIIDKPCGLESTVEKVGRYLGLRQIYLVHRLDKATSGLMLIAKTLEAKEELDRCFKERLINKEYHAVVEGKLKRSSGMIENYIGVHAQFNGRKKMGVVHSKNGRFAKTAYEVVRRAKTTTLVRLRPYTGRTHQLRLHMKGLGSPICGDPLYGDDRIGSKQGYNRLFLHASSLKFKHPIFQNEMIYCSKLPFYRT